MPCPRLWLIAVLVTCSGGPAAAQSALTPPGGSATFGAPQDQTFNAKALFDNPAIKPPPVLPVQAEVIAPPAPPPIGAGADGGLLPPQPPPPKIWSGSANFGLNGASGNTELVNVRTAFDATRKVAGNVLTSDYLYTYTQANGLTTVQQSLFNARDEHQLNGSRYSLFAATNVEYDELRAYRFRVGVYGGVGYAVVDDADLTFKLRAGAGAVRELGSRGTPSRWVPEAVFGYDFRYRVSERSSLVSILDYYPRIDDPAMFRVRARLGFEQILDPENGVVLRLGLQDRYDSFPGNAKRNDLTYFATLGMKF